MFSHVFVLAGGGGGGVLYMGSIQGTLKPKTVGHHTDSPSVYSGDHTGIPTIQGGGGHSIDLRPKKVLRVPTSSVSVRPRKVHL